jgi:glutathione peroxidase-family protein
MNPMQGRNYYKNQTIYDFNAVTIDGYNYSLKYLKGKYLLILNMDKNKPKCE